jgi:hypothetical protein
VAYLELGAVVFEHAVGLHYIGADLAAETDFRPSTPPITPIASCSQPVRMIYTKISVDIG